MSGGALTYCLNIHPAETWEELRATLLGPARAVKAEISPDAPFPLGLRLSAQTVADLQIREARDELRHLLRREGFRAVTVNGFPFGRFHDARVKEDVYLPDWRSEERLRYTCELADIMAHIAPEDLAEGEAISLSTVPGAFRPLGIGAEGLMARNYLRAAAHLVALEARSGVRIALAIEPEPFCFLETIAETICFFRDHLYSEEAARFLAELSGLELQAAREALPRHLGLCYDVCHAAVEYEDPEESVAALEAAGIPIHKLQLSAALRLPRVDAATRDALAQFEEPTYLHQVIVRRGAELSYFRDLPEALARGSEADGEEWRVHFHVPVYLDDLGAFSSTQDFLRRIIARHRERPISPHLEVETYTFDVLPERLRPATVEEAITAELRWVRQELDR
jgi:sugar phosphate isomerase/epimerase